MTATASAPPLILIAAIPEHSLASVFQGRHYAVVQVHTATLAAEWVRDVRPDTIIIDAELPDMSGIDACRLLHSDPRIGHTVPTLILAPNKPTPEQRVAALRAGVWDFLLYPPDREELSLSLDTYLQAKRNIGGALRDVVGASGSSAAARAVQIGYDAVPNLKYSPIDPVALLLRATTAVRTGTPEPGCSWMRRFDESKTSAREAGAAPRTTPSGLVRGNRGTGV